MLQLKDIVKTYEVGDNSVKALNGVNMTFRENEFVSILGPSGCGKTTLLNIIGGLDKYTSGDLIINGVSTKKYRSRDWDTYRNHSIGFVFQSYNLIPHQTVLANVELALTLSGVSKRERRRRAVEALEKVGLGDQLKKKPNQMSGGQMQRVAIARALVNDPDILLADEPTGALDTNTSGQIMDILAEVAEKKLVIMVTHNPDLALAYSTRIIKLLDGHVVSDSLPVTDTELGLVSDMLPDEHKTVKETKTKYWQSKAKKENVIKEDDGYEPMEKVTYKVEKLKPLSEKELLKKRKEEAKAHKNPDNLVKSTENTDVPKEEVHKTTEHTKKHTSMNLLTALSLSLNNLMTKKARTLLTAFAGSIGIIGIALIVSLSNGVQLYIDGVEEDTLSSYPLTIEKTTIDITGFMSSMQNTQKEKEVHEDNKIYTNQIMTGFMDLMLKEVEENNLKDFKTYIEDNRAEFDPLTSDIEYVYSTTMNLYRSDIENGIYKVNPGQVYSNLGMGGRNGSGSGAGGLAGMTSNVFTRLINNQKLLEEQYEVIYGRFPERFDEVVLMVSNNNEITDFTLYTLGILDSAELGDVFRRMAMGEDVSFDVPLSYTYEELTSLSFKLMLNSDYFDKQGNVWVDRSNDEIFLMDKLRNAHEIKIVGILRSDSDAAMAGMAGTIGYRGELMEYLINEVNNSDIVREQKNNPDVDIFTGYKFPSDENDDSESLTMEELNMYIATLSEEEQQQYNASIEQMKSYGMTDDKILETFAQAMKEAQTSDATYDGNLKKLGVSDPSNPSMINIFPKDFESKDSLTDIIARYNDSKPEESRITYTDYVGLIMSSVTTIINAISYILIAFVSISLVVSSIMIGIITYISVLERTKEIGILRAIGASKRDVSRVFNAETLIIGFTAGFLGILISMLLLIPINAIIYHITDIEGIAVLPYQAAILLVVISMVLTLIAGIFPSRIAARKDPVVALRTE